MVLIVICQVNIRITLPCPRYSGYKYRNSSESSCSKCEHELSSFRVLQSTDYSLEQTVEAFFSQHFRISFPRPACRDLRPNADDIAVRVQGSPFSPLLNFDNRFFECRNSLSTLGAGATVSTAFARPCSKRSCTRWRMGLPKKSTSAIS